MTKPIRDRILLKRIRLDGNTQQRDEHEPAVQDRIAKYAACVGRLPPVELVFDGKVYWPWDGHLRIRAHQKAGCKEILANVRRGQRRDAILLSLGVNDSHGLARTNDDIRRAVELALNDPEWSQQPNTWIAERCSVDEKTVRNHRARLAGLSKTSKVDHSEVPINGQPQSVIPALPEEWGDVFDAMTPEQKLRYEAEQAADLAREQAKQDVRSWLERLETWARRGVELFRVRPEIAARDLKAVEQRIETILKTGRKYEE